MIFRSNAEMWVNLPCWVDSDVSKYHKVQEIFFNTHKKNDSPWISLVPQFTPFGVHIL